MIFDFIEEGTVEWLHEQTLRLLTPAWGERTKMPKMRLSDTDLDFIVANTAYKDRELLRMQFNNFCDKHPEGHITKKDFRAMMRTCYPGR